MARRLCQNDFHPQTVATNRFLGDESIFGATIHLSQRRFFFRGDEFIWLRLFIERRKLLKGTNLGFRAMTSHAARNFPTAFVIQVGEFKG